MSDKQIIDFSAVITPALTDVHVVQQSGVTKKETTEQILSLIDADIIDITSLSWKTDDNTWTFSSANTYFPEYVFNVNADATGYLYVGQKIKYTQSSVVKYGIIVSVGTYTGALTPVTIYGGGTVSSPSYQLTNTTITSPCYATIGRPVDFPSSPITWSTIFSSSTAPYMDDDTTNIVSGTWYGGTNLWTSGSVVSPYLGTGVWDISFSGTGYIMQANSSSNEDIQMYMTLSSSGSSESDSGFTSGMYFRLNSGSEVEDLDYFSSFFKRQNIVLTAVTQFWVMMKAVWGSHGDTDWLQIRGDINPTKVVAQCAYL